MKTPRNHISALLFRIFSLGAGQATGENKIEGGAGEVRDGGSLIAGPLADGGEEDDGAGGKSGDAGSAPGDAGKRVTKDKDDENSESEDDESEDEDDEGDEPNGESDGDDANPDGDGAEDDEDGVDPAISLSITRNWQARFDATKGAKEADPLTMVRALKPTLSKEKRDQITQLFKEEKDIDAILEVVASIVPEFLGSYDASRVSPVLTEHQLNIRQAKLLSKIADFDEKHPGVRTKKITDKMAAKYNEFKDEYGFQYADQVPVEDYVIMAGGNLRKKGGAKVTPPKAKTRAEEAEDDKQKALSSVRQPDRIGRPKNAGAGKKERTERDEVKDFTRSIRNRDADPFIIR